MNVWNSTKNIKNKLRSSLPLNQIEKTKRKQTINILTTCFICLIGLFPIAIMFMINKKNINNDDYMLLFGIFTLFIEASYIFNFIFFIFFNPKFRQITIKMFDFHSV
jgi:hypothetical protein